MERHRAAGVQSIDVGCMQVNLVHHAGAFASLDQAFDPQSNATYAAGFLSRLQSEMADWPKAASAYHSRTPDLAAKYLEKVVAIWPLASQYGAVTSVVRGRSEPLRVDPYGIYTGEFAARRLQDARDRATRNATLRWEQPRTTVMRGGSASTAARSLRTYRSAQAG